ncbi:hypothetical protein AAFF_G00075010 [Aldrovandia affinis]|uniref:Uncharacterized protein n=1 Tax=Aldrovandia affinis TaxID=143900 RepID=A0AAD7S0I3_9TELE|nr:hypothetical protein AAFF_G00075010 [Aldrovandia affinis]
MSLAKRKPTMISRAKLGEKLFTKTNDFVLTDPQMHIIKPRYNSLHDPHLRKYYHRKDVQGLLRKRSFISGENEVKCSFHEYKTYQRYLEHLKLTADRTVGEIQKARMRWFLEQQLEGLIPGDISLADMREELLEEEVDRLRQVMQMEAARMKNKDDKEDFSIEVDLLSWKVEERIRLRKIERDVRHEWNKEKQLREMQERREKKKHAAYLRKCAVCEMQIIQQVKMSEESVIEDRRKRSAQSSRASGQTERAQRRSQRARAGQGILVAEGVERRPKSKIRVTYV